MGFEFLDNWTDMMPRSGGHVISVYGSGGKTSLIEAWAEWYKKNEIPVIVTTTVHVGNDQFQSLPMQHWDSLKSELPQALFVGQEGEKYKSGLTIEQVDLLADKYPNYVVLVEADGSRNMPMKLHRDDEPLIPKSTTLAVPVVGLSAIGNKVENILHRYGREGFHPPEIKTSNKNGDPIWGWDETYELLTRETGYFGRVPEDVPVMLALCQMDDCDDSIGLFSFMDKIMEQVPLIVMGDLSDLEPRMKAVFSTDYES